MSKQSPLADKMKSGKPVFTGWSLLASPMIAEFMASSGYEAVTLDLQHGMYDFDSACEAMAHIALAGSHRIVRLPVGDYSVAGRLADMGAECLIAPMINSREDAEAFASAIKYPPVGERSWGPFRAAMLSGQTAEEYTGTANRQTLALAMIETQEAFDALDEILSVDSLDGVFVGPADLSLTLSKGAKLDPNGAHMIEICAGIALKAKAAGKLSGIFCNAADKANEAAAQGFNLISHGIDTVFLDQGARAALAEIK
ncbi:MAG: aldolase/citrate lyase family protein [Roseibium sp.]